MVVNEPRVKDLGHPNQAPLAHRGLYVLPSSSFAERILQASKSRHLAGVSSNAGPPIRLCIPRGSSPLSSILSDLLDSGM